MTSKLPLQKRRKYDEHFKADALKMVENGQAVSQISKSLTGRKRKPHLRLEERAQIKGERNSQRRESGCSLRLPEEKEQLKEKVKQSEMEREIPDPMLMHVCWSGKAVYIFSRLTRG
jgi:transposase-like protein